jgi:hypothetical protein
MSAPGISQPTGTLKRLTPDDVDSSSSDSEDQIDFDVLADIEPAVKEIVANKARRLIGKLQSATADPDSNPTYQALVDRYKQAQEFALPHSGSDPVVRPRGQKTKKGDGIKGLSKKYVTEAVKSRTTDMDYATVTFQGQWNEEGTASGPAHKNAVRDLQLANEIAQAMISAVKNATEIELMIVNDRILVSANEQKAVQDLCKKSLDELLADLSTVSAEQFEERNEGFAKRKIDKIDAIRNALDDDDNAEQTGSGRLADLAVDSHFWPEQAESVRGALTTLKEAHLKIVQGGSPAEAAKLIDDDTYRGRIIAVDASELASGPCTHAEQNLALALVHSGYQGAATIAGGKRPCTVCYLSLCLVSQCGFGQLRFNGHPGGYWKTTTVAGLHKIATALRLDPAQLTEQLAAISQDGLEQFVTDTDPDAPPSTWIDDLREAVATKLYNTDTATQSQSPLHNDSYTPPSSPSQHGQDDEDDEGGPTTTTTTTTTASQDDS